MKDSAITYESFSFSGKSENCYGLEIVKQVLSKHNIFVLPFDTQTKNTILVSLYWPEQLFDFVKWRYKSEMRNRRIIIGGNYATTSPSVILPFCNYIYLGDSEHWDGQVNSPYIIPNGNPKKRAIANYLLPYLYEDLQNSRRAFCEISRGCKNKCLFCQYGWLKPYKEIDYIDIEQIIKRCKTKSIRVFAADRFQHSNYLRIRQTMDKLGKCDTGSDLSVKYILKYPEYLKFTNKVRVGIEGLSSRLRSLINKPLINDDIITFCKLVADAGIKCLDIYMIYGLPTETDEDVEEFRELIIALDKIMPKNYTIAIHWNAFTPSPQTPFQWERPAWGQFKILRKFLYEDHTNKRIKIYHKPKLTSEWTILRRMLSLRGDESTAKLIYNFAFKESQFKKNPNFLLKEYEQCVGQDLIGQWPENKSLPWDKYCIYEKDKMLKLAKTMKAKYA